MASCFVSHPKSEPLEINNAGARARLKEDLSFLRELGHELAYPVLSYVLL